MSKALNKRQMSLQCQNMKTDVPSPLWQSDSEALITMPGRVYSDVNSQL